MKFAKIFDFEDGNQVLIVRDGKNERLTVSTIIDDQFRTMSPKLEDTPFTINSLFEMFNKDMAAEIRKEMMEIDYDSYE